MVLTVYNIGSFIDYKSWLILSNFFMRGCCNQARSQDFSRRVR